MNEKETIDLHVHTNRSDGDMSPTEIVNMSKQRKLSAVAITDHDTTEGLDEAIRAGARQGIDVIPGIELTMSCMSGTLHVVGLYINHNYSELVQELARIKEDRKGRAIEILRQLNLVLANEQKEITEEESIGQAFGSVGRMHIAKAMVKKGYVDNIEQAFDMYLKKLDLPKRKIGYMEGFALLNLAGAIPVLAHALRRNDNSLLTITSKPQEQKKVLFELREHGLIGVECARERQEFRDMVQSLDLIVTDASDYHGPSQPEYAELGSLMVPRTVLDNLQAAKENYQRKKYSK
ncbi:PHP domain-containing protein [Candidatus Woesearchaeota archaeon]|nr:PHP domain-containing protein [Candidatus Woesearchaeota archaeon]MBW3006462.1 PHP domain-containing protein [Candidatus Woesearchaeota archaeon]